MTSEKEKFQTIKGKGEERRPAEKVNEELQFLAEKYGCDESLNPRWCVYGVDRFGNFGVKHWIEPVDEDELVAWKIAKLQNELGGDMKAHMTEWNEHLKGEPIYGKRFSQ